jgi:malate dehydrogenase (oxaloacetate-decarboxylating)(NADP+)
VVAAAYAGATLSFGPEYLIPKPFDPRLMMKIAPAVAQAAADAGVALRPIADMDAYREKLQTFVYHSGTTMKPIFTLAKGAKHKRVVFCEGRGRAHPARGAGGGGREPGAAHADRPARGHRAAR